MKQAKVTIVCIILFSYVYNFPHFILTRQVGRQCVPYGSAIKYIYGQFYYWFSTILSFFLQFVLLLIMNSFIIHTLYKRSISNHTRSGTQDQTQGHGENGQGQSTRIKNSDYQIFSILLFVTFAFLILNTPPYALFLFAMFYDYEQSVLPLPAIICSTTLPDKLTTQITVLISTCTLSQGRNSGLI